MRPPKARRIVVAAPLGRYRRLSRGTASNDLPNTLHETRKSRQIAVLTKDPVRSGLRTQSAAGNSAGALASAGVGLRSAL